MATTSISSDPTTEGAASAVPSPPKPKSRVWTEEQRAAARERMKGNRLGAKDKSEPAPPKPDLKNIPEDEKAMVGALLGTAWEFAGPYFKVAPLDDSEKLRLGAAAAPVIRKYLPLLGDWSLEVNLVMVALALYQSKRASYEPAKKTDGPANIPMTPFNLRDSKPSFEAIE